MENNKNVDIKEINERIEKESAFIDLLVLEINKVIVVINKQHTKQVSKYLDINDDIDIIYGCETRQ